MFKPDQETLDSLKDAGASANTLWELAIAAAENAKLKAEDLDALESALVRMLAEVRTVKTLWEEGGFR